MSFEESEWRFVFMSAEGSVTKAGSLIHTQSVPSGLETEHTDTLTNVLFFKKKKQKIIVWIWWI